jgi:uncharacterized protein
MAIQKPLEEGYFKISDDGKLTLLGSYSKTADEYFFPRRKLCPISGEPVEDVELPREGALYSWTYVFMPMMGADNKGHGIGQVDLPNGVRVQAVIEGNQGDWEIDMPMVVKPLTVMKKDEIEWCSFQFAPIKSGGSKNER